MPAPSRPSRHHQKGQVVLAYAEEIAAQVERVVRIVVWLPSIQVRIAGHKGGHGLEFRLALQRAALSPYPRTMAKGLRG